MEEESEEFLDADTRLANYFNGDVPSFVARGRRDRKAIRAKSTSLASERNWAKFVEFAAVHGPKDASVLPAAPELVYVYGLHMAGRTKAYWDGNGGYTYDMLPVNMDDDPWAEGGGENGYHLTLSTLNQHLSAITARHLEAGFDDPTDDPLVDALRKIWSTKTKDRATKQALPLTDTVLKEVFDAIYMSLADVRDDAAIVLHEAGVSFKALARLEWEDVLVLESGKNCRIETTGFTSRGVAEVELPLKVTPHLLAWRTALAERGLLRTDRRVFCPIGKDGIADADGTVTAQGVRNAINRREFGEYSELTHADLRDITALLLARTSMHRSDETLRLKWRNLQPRKGGGLIISRGSAKNDQKGTGLVTAALPSVEPRLDVVSNVAEWRKVWAEIVGREPSDEDPVVIPTRPGDLRWERKKRTESKTGKGTTVTETRRGKAPKGKGWELKALSYSSYNDMFHRRGAAAGHPDLTTHSPRVGGAVDARKDGASLAEIANVGGWADPKSVVGYTRNVKPGGKGSVEWLRQERLKEEAGFPTDPDSDKQSDSREESF